ncbi:glycosyl hydrolase family 95 catalytic domain-containing protein [Sphingobacterium thalpophilum]|uniref:glycosyl hydrolase family 95 catalytic domain-containing protein n=1 Tax=Sphingobacterium thalpophilum TaxID=259 RepID=UPI002D77D7AF|nr:hypothetical protein [Sphingobacterium thalpophilum]
MKRRVLLSIIYTLVLYLSAALSQVKVAPLGRTIYEGIFTGNGLLGTMTYVSDQNSLRIDIGRTDVYDHRPHSADKLFDKARMSLGHFKLDFGTAILGAEGDIYLQEAFADAKVETDRGSVSVRTTTLSEDNIIVVEVFGKNFKGQHTLLWVPDSAISPRMKFSYTQKPTHYVPNPRGSQGQRGDVKYFDQPLTAGGGYTTAYRRWTSGDVDTYVITVGFSQKGQDYTAKAIDYLGNFDRRNIASALKVHRQWWADYYKASTLRLPDANYQRFYDMQLYKLASATRADKPAIDLQGPWTSPTPWPAYWHNLNIQLTYSPVFKANQLGIAKSLIQMVDRNRENLRLNVPEPYRHNSIALGRSSAPDLRSPVALQKNVSLDGVPDEKKELGNLLWLLHSYYLYYRATMSSEVYDRLFPLLKSAVNYHLHLLEKDHAGKYYISVKTYSPEYSKGFAYNTNYDLSILRWGLKALLDLDNERGGRDSLHGMWKDVLTHLIAYPQDENGFMIATNVPYAESHRHYSHLMMIYPFYDVNWDQHENRALIERSVAHWQSKKQWLQGYSFSGAASMYAMMGKGDAALASLDTLLNRYVKPNTLYAESGPVIETPLAAMASIQELCMQHWNGVLRIFPAVPTTWRELSFINFLADGGNLVSANRRNGKTERVQIKSQYGGTVVLKVDLQDPIVKLDRKGQYTIQENGFIRLNLSKGTTAFIYERK